LAYALVAHAVDGAVGPLRGRGGEGRGVGERELFKDILHVLLDIARAAIEDGADLVIALGLYDSSHDFAFAGR
jgi:hypothetical protein